MLVWEDLAASLVALLSCDVAMDRFGKSITQRQKKGVYFNSHFTTETTLLAGIARKFNKYL